MEKYLGLTSGQLLSNMMINLEDTYQSLQSLYWRDGEKPHDEQLKVVQKCSKSIEDLYEDYFQYHIKAIRGMKIFCPQTLKCLNNYQVYRKDGLIALLKKYYPNLGKRVLKQPRSKPSFNYANGENIFDAADDKFGFYHEDWYWAQINGVVGKVVSKYKNIKLKGLEVFTNEFVQNNGHEWFANRINQPLFDTIFKEINVVNPVAKMKFKTVYSTKNEFLDATAYTYTTPLEMPKF